MNKGIEIKSVNDLSGTNREYKDRLFIFIFGREENKEWTLKLFNTVNGSDYEDASLIEFNTLEEFQSEHATQNAGICQRSVFWICSISSL